MKKLLMSIFMIAFVSAGMAGQGGYFGLHGNTSWSTTKDGTRRLDDGHTASKPNFSITAGIEQKIGDDKDVRPILAGEFFFDNINKATVQDGASSGSMAGKSIYKTKFLTGLRGKFGVSLSELVDVYGNVGLAFWERDLYIGGAYYELFSDTNWKFMPFIGLGATVRVNDRWAVNANYMKVLKSTISDLEAAYGYSDGKIQLGLDVLTIGVQRYF